MNWTPSTEKDAVGLNLLSLRGINSDERERKTVVLMQLEGQLPSFL